MLNNRLKQVVGELVSRSHSAFLAGRNIVVCTLLAHEIVRDFKEKIGASACLKADLNKAFDSVNKEFVLFIMRCMGFSGILVSGLIGLESV